MCGDCILKREDPAINCGGLDPIHTFLIATMTKDDYKCLTDVLSQVKSSHEAD